MVIIFLQQQKKLPHQITENDASNDVLELIAQETMYEFLTREMPYHCCPLYRWMCKNTSFSKDECFGTPWLGAPCTFTIISSPLELDKKNVHW